MTLDFRKIIRDSANTKLSMLETCIDDIVRASEIMLESIKNGNKILWCGNGGSAADAQHMAAELMGGLRSHKRKPIASIALTTDTSFITAWANDISYHHIFSRQIERPYEIVSEIRTLLQSLDAHEKHFSKTGDTIILLMLCSRSSLAVGDTPDLNKIRHRLRTKRLENYAEGFLQNLYQDARIIIK